MYFVLVVFVQYMLGGGNDSAKPNAKEKKRAIREGNLFKANIDGSLENACRIQETSLKG